MRTLTSVLAFSLFLGAAGCGEGGSDLSASDSDPDRSEKTDSHEESIAVGEPNGNGSDPMAHIAYLASDTMKGRNSPSADLNNAATYIKAFLSTNGLTGPNPGDTNGPYAQTFTVLSFTEAGLAAHDPHDPHDHGDDAARTHASAFGVELFEEAFFLDDQMSLGARQVVDLRYEQAMKAKGKTVAALKPGALRSVKELSSEALLAGPVQNVLGTLTGTGLKSNEVILVMAHLDHIGTTTGGVVYNGADDNASGSATILSAIPALAAAQQAGQLNRSVLFFWTAGEEKGLLGAQYFVDHPIAGIGLSNIVGVVNMDMVGRWDDQRLSVIDTNLAGTPNYLRTILESSNAALPDPFNTLNRDIMSYIDRQDGWPFLNAGEDVLFVFEGLSNAAGGGSLNADYHATGDDIDKIIQDNGGNKPRRVRDLLVGIVKQAANR